MKKLMFIFVATCCIALCSYASPPITAHAKQQFTDLPTLSTADIPSIAMTNLVKAPLVVPLQQQMAMISTYAIPASVQPVPITTAGNTDMQPCENSTLAVTHVKTTCDPPDIPIAPQSVVANNEPASTKIQIPDTPQLAASSSDCIAPTAKEVIQKE